MGRRTNRVPDGAVLIVVRKAVAGFSATQTMQHDFVLKPNCRKAWHAVLPTEESDRHDHLRRVDVLAWKAASSTRCNPPEIKQGPIR